MALHTELPIYRTGVRLLDLAVKAQVQMPRTVKRVLGEKITQHCVEMLDLMALANATQRDVRAGHIDHLLTHQRAITVLLRVSHDARYISPKLWADSIELLGEASLDGYWFGERHPISPFWWRERLRAAQPATAPEQKPLVVMWAMYFRGYPEEPECKPAFMEDWRVYSDAASWDAEIDRANRNYQNHDNPTPGWLPYEARPVYVYAEAQPAIAPEPSWQDAPTVPGLWVVDEKLWRITKPELHEGSEDRWLGPLPEDKS